jgi:Predicted 3''-5'' exonuclease related to the exonuclease domain of PolB.
MVRLAAGKLEQIRQRNEIDALNTYLIYLRFQHLRSAITPAQYETESELVKNSLVQLDMPHWHEYLRG